MKSSKTRFFYAVFFGAGVIGYIPVGQGSLINENNQNTQPLDNEEIKTDGENFNTDDKDYNAKNEKIKNVNEEIKVRVSEPQNTSQVALDPRLKTEINQLSQLEREISKTWFNNINTKNFRHNIFSDKTGEVKKIIEKIKELTSYYYSLIERFSLTTEMKQDKVWRTLLDLGKEVSNYYSKPYKNSNEIGSQAEKKTTDKIEKLKNDLQNQQYEWYQIIADQESEKTVNLLKNAVKSLSETVNELRSFDKKWKQLGMMETDHVFQKLYQKYDQMRTDEIVLNQKTAGRYRASAVTQWISNWLREISNLLLNSELNTRKNPSSAKKEFDIIFETINELSGLQTSLYSRKGYLEKVEELVKKASQQISHSMELDVDEYKDIINPERHQKPQKKYMRTMTGTLTSAGNFINKNKKKLNKLLDKGFKATKDVYWTDRP